VSSLPPVCIDAGTHLRQYRHGIILNTEVGYCSGCPARRHCLVSMSFMVGISGGGEGMEAGGKARHASWNVRQAFLASTIDPCELISVTCKLPFGSRLMLIAVVRHCTTFPIRSTFEVIPASIQLLWTHSCMVRSELHKPFTWWSSAPLDESRSLLVDAGLPPAITSHECKCLR